MKRAMSKSFSHTSMIILASSIWQMKSKLKTDETSHEQIFLTHEHDYPGEFHLTNKIKL